MKAVGVFYALFSKFLSGCSCCHGRDERSETPRAFNDALASDMLPTYDPDTYDPGRAPYIRCRETEGVNATQ